jgi:hypothetical protein
MTTPDWIEGRLGRQPAVFDPRNLDYRSRPLLNERGVQRKTTYWRMPPGSWPLDQGNSPECTGYGMAHEAACDPVVIPGVDAAWAHQRYQRNVEEDHLAGRYYDGGATVQATMAAAKKDNVVSGYIWNLGVADTLDALCTVGPQTLGTTWKSGMFSPTSDGLLRVTGSDVGGHFYMAAARVEVHPKFGPGSWIVNSWGIWGVGVPELGLATGCAFLRDEDLATLLAEDGESVAPRDLYVAPMPAAVLFVARRRSSVFHGVRCRLAPSTDRREFVSRDDAVAAGLRPCWWCKP